MFALSLQWCFGYCRSKKKNVILYVLIRRRNQTKVCTNN